jgi:ankyrin repeat protein
MKTHFDPTLSKSIRECDVDAVAHYFAKNPQHKDAYTPFAGGAWLHYAAGAADVRVVKCLVELGLDVNRGDHRDGRLPLKDATYENKLDNARFLLDAGSVMDTSASVRNALFAAIVGKSPDIARLLLERGIDATVRYTSETMENMDATAFALMRGEGEIARIIALHNAQGDEAKAAALLAEAQAIATRHGPLKPIRIVPTEADLADE